MTQQKKILIVVGMVALIGISIQVYNAYTFKKIKDNIIKE